MSVDRIPLFPLDMVLFPGQAVPLHIFERRYRLMTRQCIDTESPFGLILFHEGRLAQTGCSAMIVKVLKEYEDGRSDILTIGKRAFRLLRMRDEQPYFEGEIEYLDDDFAGVNPKVSAQLDVLFQQCHHILFDKQDPPAFDTEGGISFAYHVASELPIETVLRQELLEMRSEAQRQRRLLERLAEWYPQLQARERVRGKATGNGHHKL